jgi:hypothetical protein
VKFNISTILPQDQAKPDISGKIHAKYLVKRLNILKALESCGPAEHYEYLPFSISIQVK